MNNSYKISSRIDMNKIVEKNSTKQLDKKLKSIILN